MSGGLDSVSTAAYLRKNEKYDIYMLTYSYGQRAAREIQRAQKFAKTLEAEEHRIIDIGFMKELYGGSNVLTDDSQQLPKKFKHNIVVPVRNAIFVTIAAAWAISIDATLVSYGAHTGDNNYPDCRISFIKSMNNTLNLADSDRIRSKLGKRIILWCPALYGIDKPTLLKIGYDILGDEIFKAWSCYSNGVLDKSHNIFAHCGKCESCLNRRNAFKKAGLADKTLYDDF